MGLIFGGVNFWWLVVRHAIGGEKFGESSTTGLLCIVVYMVTFKNLVGKILAGLDKSATIRILYYKVCVFKALKMDVQIKTCFCRPASQI